MIDSKASHIGSWQTILSPPWAQRRKWIPIGSKVDHKCNVTNQGLRGERGPIKYAMQWKKTLKSLKKKDHWVINIHTLALSPAQDFKRTQCEL